MSRDQHNGGAQMGGVSAEFRRLKEDSSASMAELQEFLSSTRGKSPQEVMGAVANSGLFASTLTAAAVVAAVLVLLTVGPYALRSSSSSAKAASASANPAAAGADGAGEPAAFAAAGKAAPAEALSTNVVDGQKAVDAMGIGETKAADAKVNPLENQLDDLLDSIK